MKFSVPDKSLPVTETRIFNTQKIVYILYKRVYSCNFWRLYVQKFWKKICFLTSKNAIFWLNVVKIRDMTSFCCHGNHSYKRYLYKCTERCKGFFPVEIEAIEVCLRLLSLLVKATLYYIAFDKVMWLLLVKLSWPQSHKPASHPSYGTLIILVFTTSDV